MKCIRLIKNGEAICRISETLDSDEICFSGVHQKVSEQI